MYYQVKKQYGRGSESLCASFSDLNDAKLFVEAKLTADLGINVVIYRIYEGADIIEVYDPEKRQASAAQTEGSQGQTSTSGFRPSPFNTAPRPTGMPQKWLKDDEEKK